MSREVAFACDLDGRIGWCCSRAAARLGAREGMHLRELAAPGTAGKVDALVARARQQSVDDWELGLVSGDAIVTYSFRALPHEGGLVLVGAHVPSAYGRAFAQVSEHIHEISELHRQAVRDQDELTRRAVELSRTNAELADSNRGVMALYVQLDEQAKTLRRNADTKTRLVGNISHEFRTPLNSILGLTRLLLDHTDGTLTEEQERQIRFIRNSADSLSQLVNDMLDLSRAEHGAGGLRIARFRLEDLFSALRGTLRPIATNPDVELVFDAVDGSLELETDESRLAQILRNLVSNALKFTERGHVRVSAATRDGEIVFEVEDTGIGIPRDEQERIFEEFAQVDGPLQRKHRGTGLGLCIARRLAELLGGDIRVESEVGRGSTFRVLIPSVHEEARAMHQLEERSRDIDPMRAPILVVEDDRKSLFLYEKYLAGSGFQVLPARTIDEARAQLRRVRPAAVVLDVMLDGETSWQFLADMKSHEETRDIPILVVTVTNREQHARALGADEFWLKPLDKSALLRKLSQLARRGPVQKILIIDDDEVARYVLRRHLADTHHDVLEARSGHEGVTLARTSLPDLIFLDFVLPDIPAFDVLDELKHDARTRHIPVIVHTGKSLDDEERKRLEAEAAAILHKQNLSRELAIGRIREALLNAGVRPSVGVERQ